MSDEDERRPVVFVLEREGDVDLVSVAMTTPVLQARGFDVDLFVADVTGDTCLVHLSQKQAEKIGHALLQAARHIPRR